MTSCATSVNVVALQYGRREHHNGSTRNALNCACVIVDVLGSVVAENSYVIIAFHYYCISCINQIWHIRLLPNFIRHSSKWNCMHLASELYLLQLGPNLAISQT